jgi:large subunit ribosomal protein L4e
VSASALTALVQGRGHRVNKLAELPLVVDFDVNVDQTKKANELFAKLGLNEDLTASKKSKKIRAGVGKYRNRRFKMKKGPLVVHNGEMEKLRAFRNLPGLEFCHVNSLSIIKLAPGGHLGRLCVWSKSAFDQLDNVFGTATRPSERTFNARNWSLPKTCMTNTDVEKILSSDEVYNVLDKNPKLPLCTLKRGNPIKNSKVMATLNPFLSGDASIRDKKRAEWRKSIDGKLKKLDTLSEKRKQALWTELNNTE